MQYSEQRHVTHTQESCRRYYKSFESTGNFFWAVEEVVEGLGHIGNINAYVNEANRIADLGVLIGEKSARGRGYATEAIEAVIAFLFGKGDVRKITVGMMSINQPMMQVAQKLKMMVDGGRRGYYLYNGQPVDAVYWALSHGQWKKRADKVSPR